MIGKRIEDGKWPENPGEYSKHITLEQGGTVTRIVWFAVVPSGEIGCLREHRVEEHEDGTITVSPSILVSGTRKWHGYLEQGIWREC